MNKNTYKVYCTKFKVFSKSSVAMQVELSLYIESKEIELIYQSDHPRILVHLAKSHANGLCFTLFNVESFE
jgi:hypothetical protein